MHLLRGVVDVGLRLFTFDELKRAYHRLSDRTVPLPTVAAWVAYVALRTARLTNTLSRLQNYYLSTRPIVDAAAPPSLVYDAHYLHLRLNRIYDLPDVEVDDTRPRTVNVLVPAFEFRSMSAGFFGVFQFAQFLARTGYHVRLVMFDNFYFDEGRFRDLLKGYPGLEMLFDMCETQYIGERVQPLRVNAADICVATVWYSAYFAEKIHRSLRRKDFIYLIQDYETAFYPANSSSAQADISYDFDYTAVFSSESLRDYFLERDVGRIKSGQRRYVFFNNACSARLEPEAQFVRRQGTPRKKRLAFYSRPVVDRNMFELSALVLCEAVARGVLDPEKWDVYGMGLGEGVVQLSAGVRTTSLPRMNLEEYLQMVGTFDVCLTLMASPHPSMIPMDLACSGAIVVTNTFGPKTSDYLEGLCGNIIAAKPTLDDLIGALAEGIRRSDDLASRYSAAQSSTYPRSWEETFTPEHVRFLRATIDPPVARAAEAPASNDLSSSAAPAYPVFAPAMLTEHRRTYAILGNGRGGTSMVAGMAAALGLPLLPNVHGSMLFEDAEIVAAAQGLDHANRDLGLSPLERRNKLIGLIHARNASTDVWGWKDPSADLYLESIVPELRNPHFLLVCRDLAAVAGAHVVVNGADAEEALDWAIARYDRYWDILRRLRRPTLLVSYERGRQRPLELASELSAFFGIDASEADRRRAANFVSSSGGYRTLATDPYLEIEKTQDDERVRWQTGTTRH